MNSSQSNRKISFRGFRSGLGTGAKSSINCPNYIMCSAASRQPDKLSL